MAILTTGPRIQRRWFLSLLLTISCVRLIAQPTEAADEVSFIVRTGRLEVLAGGERIATYVWEDPSIPRPYFSNVRAPGGSQVTRSHPPDPVINKNNDDHETYHPGIWLAFGDLNGLDFWRNKARVRHVRFLQTPEEVPGKGAFTVLNAYEPLDAASGPVAMEACSYFFHVTQTGYFLIARSTFQSESDDIEFGDQEEMGFGVRMQTPLTVKFGDGVILNSNGGLNEAGTWGKQAQWCSFFGKVDGATVGVTLMPGPDNFRPAWFHSRDYGLIVANPFGRKSMTAPDDAGVMPDRTTVRRGSPFTLTFGLRIFSTQASNGVDHDFAYRTFLELLKTDPAPVVP